MSRHITNIALTYSEVPLKTFVKEKNEASLENEKKSKFKLAFKGTEAKLAYDEIISIKNQRKSLPRKCNLPIEDNKCIPKPPIKSKIADTNNVNNFFKAIESADTNFITHNFNSENVNITDQFGWTPLMSAAYSGHIKIVEFLLKLGANLKAKDKSGLTATDLALKKNHLHVINLLKENFHKDNKGINKNNKVFKDAKCDKERLDDQGFYCDICKILFMESSRDKHETSTLHVFNSKPKIGSAFYGISKQNKGYQMLLSTGWNEEGGLGPDGEGQKYPVKTILKRDRKGFGQSDKNIAKITHFNPKDINAVKFINRNKRKALKKKDWKKQLSREATKTKALRQALS